MRGNRARVPPIFSGPFGEVGEVFVWVKSLGGKSRKVKALFKAGFGPGLDRVLEWRCIKLKNPGSDYCFIFVLEKNLGGRMGKRKLGQQIGDGLMT